MRPLVFALLLVGATGIVAGAIGFDVFIDAAIYDRPASPVLALVELVIGVLGFEGVVVIRRALHRRTGSRPEITARARLL